MVYKRPQMGPRRMLTLGVNIKLGLRTFVVILIDLTRYWFYLVAGICVSCVEFSYFLHHVIHTQACPYFKYSFHISQSLPRFRPTFGSQSTVETVWVSFHLSFCPHGLSAYSMFLSFWITKHRQSNPLLLCEMLAEHLNAVLFSAEIFAAAAGIRWWEFISNANRLLRNILWGRDRLYWESCEMKPLSSSV